MKKRIMTMSVLLLSVAPAMAQVFIMNDEKTKREETQDFSIMVPYNNVGYDQYAPVGTGAALLIGLGAAYLLAKKRKDN